MPEAPKLLANISENIVYVTLQDNYTLSVDLHTKKRNECLEEGTISYDSVTVNKKKNKIFYTSGLNVIIKKGF